MQLGGNRKFVVAMLTVVLGFILAWAGKLEAGYVNISVAVIAAFAGANAAEHFAKGWAQRKNGNGT